MPVNNKELLRLLPMKLKYQITCKDHSAFANVLQLILEKLCKVTRWSEDE